MLVAVADWQLTFRERRPFTVDACTRALATVAGAPATTAVGPREGDQRTVTITALAPTLRIETRIRQWLSSGGEPSNVLHGTTLHGPDATFAEKLAIWHALREAFAELGCTDATLADRPAPIVDEAEAVGERATAARLRAEITAQLVTYARACSNVRLISPRADDLGAILAAYRQPEQVTDVTLVDCELRELPASFARFTKVQRLTLVDAAIDGHVLRGVQLPRLTTLVLGGGVKRVRREDLAGCPDLEQLELANSQLVELDSDIVEVCRKLRRVAIAHTPLDRDTHRAAALRARWPAVAVEGGPIESSAVPVAELRAAFAAILDAPEDDAPRLELARLLAARGDARGEAVRLACELDRLAVDDPTRPAIEARLAQLPAFAFFSGPRPDLPIDVVRRRGFVEAIGCSAATFVAHADTLMTDAPIRVLDLFHVDGHGEALARCRALSRLRELRLPATTADDRTAVLGSRHLRGLRVLRVTVELEGRRVVANLDEATRGLVELAVLEIDGAVDHAACTALADLAMARRLERLDVTRARIGPTDLDALRTRLGEARVLPAPETGVSYRGGVLDLSAGTLAVDQILALIDSGRYRRAKRLVLSRTGIGDAGVAHLARSGAFPSLVALALEGAGVTDAGARVLAHEAAGLDQLEQLSLGEVPAEAPNIGARDGSGVSRAVVLELARSSRLPALRSITQSREYRIGQPGAHDDRGEGTEVIPLERPDGRVVEWCVFHMIWP